MYSYYINNTNGEKSKVMKKPTPAQLKDIRLKAGLTQQQCADIIHKSLNMWQKLEQDNSKFVIQDDSLELFLSKTGMQSYYEVLISD